jgi:hypothetical protein
MKVALLLLAIAVCALCVDGQVSWRSNDDYTSSLRALRSSNKSGLHGCAARNKSCSKCTDDNDCVWCDKQKTCVDGSWQGPDHDHHCDDWYWDQCSLEGKDVIIIGSVIVGVAGLLLILLVCCCIFSKGFRSCCCRWLTCRCGNMRCCKRRVKYEYEPLSQEIIADREPSESERRREAMREKWGL